jgi:hypothetical protein
MPRIDITAARRELLADREPIELVFNERVWEFPGSMPAEVEIEQMLVDRETRDLPEGAALPSDMNARVLKAAFGDFYDEIVTQVPQSDLMIGLGTLMQYWLEPYADPTLPQRLLTQATARIRAGGRSSNGSSSSTGARLKPTSNGSTESTSRERSGETESPGAASPSSTQVSRARR